MNTKEKFAKEKYLVVRDIISNDVAMDLSMQFEMHKDINMHYNPNINDFADTLITEHAYCWYAPYDHLLLTLKPKVEFLTGLTLLPSYSFARIYYKGATMMKHSDRPSCEISMTLTVDIDKTPWPIWIETTQGINTPIDLYPCDAMIYRGMEIEHWRNEYVEGRRQVQIFLHWVDANGQHTDFKYDKRPILGIANTKSDKELQE